MIARRQRRTTATLAVLAAAVAASCTDTPLGPDAQPQPAFSAVPVEVTFEKQFDAASSTATMLVWNGTVSVGGATGSLVSSIDLSTPGTMQTGDVLHATVRWVATGDVAFEIVTTGIVNVGNGAVRTNGRGVSGLGAGARVHQEGQLDDALGAAGFMRINPASAR